MRNFFNFSTLDIELIFKSKTLRIELKQKEHGNHINVKMLNELEQILAWCANHIEIQSIYIHSQKNKLSEGADLEELKSLEKNEISDYMEKFQKVVVGMLHLPQSIIIDAHKGCNNIAAELLIGADIVLAHQDCEIAFNHLEIGLIPQSGGISLLQKKVPASMARSWILSSLPISRQSLLASGLIYEFYTSEYDMNNLLAKIHNQSQLARIQTKAALLECHRSYIETAIEVEGMYSKSVNEAADWKREVYSNPIEFFKSQSKKRKGLTS